MKKILLLIGVISFTIPAFAQQELIDACNRFDAFNREFFLAGRVPKVKAQEEFRAFTGHIRHALSAQSQTWPASRPWVFPLQGYRYTAVGGTNGNGYNDKGFHYLDGNKHTAHPAHDIFINDKNQDGLDDRTRKPVNVLAVADGVVIAAADSWDAGSALKGGKFIWLYHPSSGIFTYYAHNRAIFVKPGDVVKQGQKIAEVGRTGLNAYKQRSPTHLHFSSFKLADDIPLPFNSFVQLKKSINQ